MVVAVAVLAEVVLAEAVLVEVVLAVAVLLDVDVVLAEAVRACGHRAIPFMFHVLHYLCS